MQTPGPNGAGLTAGVSLRGQEDAAGFQCLKVQQPKGPLFLEISSRYKNICFTLRPWAVSQRPRTPKRRHGLGCRGAGGRGEVGGRAKRWSLGGAGGGRPYPPAGFLPTGTLEASPASLLHKLGALRYKEKPIPPKKWGSRGSSRRPFNQVGGTTGFPREVACIFAGGFQFHCVAGSLTLCQEPGREHASPRSQLFQSAAAFTTPLQTSCRLACASQ